MFLSLLNKIWMHCICIKKLHIHAGLSDAVTYSLTEWVEHKKVQSH